MKRSISFPEYILNIIIVIALWTYSANSNPQLVENSFDTLDDAWQEISLSDEAHGEYKISEGKLRLITRSGLYGVYNTQSFDGHFIIDAGFEKVDYKQKALVFTMTSGLESCQFSLEPVEETLKVINPVIKINKCQKQVAAIRINGKELTGDKYRVAQVENGTLIWMQTILEEVTDVDIRLRD